jgi:hypothetical protein|tara:strand:+ start:959 stop:1231 length:273 start_codon:yes stop_codon:yes gene_type:complete
MDSFTKQPTERLDYDIDFTEWLPIGDAIITTVAISEPVGLTMAITDSATIIPKVWVSAGLDKESYVVSVTCETNQGRTKEVNFRIKVKDE